MDYLHRKLLDKTGAASHEVGHLVVAAIMGQDVRAWLIQTNIADKENARHWVGKAGSTNSFKPTADVAVAGYASEMLDVDTDICAEDCVKYVGDRTVELSETDRVAYPAEYHAQVTAFRNALTILRANRTFRDWAKAELFHNNLITNGMVSDWRKENDCTYPRNLLEKTMQDTIRED